MACDKGVKTVRSNEASETCHTASSTSRVRPRAALSRWRSRFAPRLHAETTQHKPAKMSGRLLTQDGRRGTAHQSLAPAASTHHCGTQHRDARLDSDTSRQPALSQLCAQNQATSV